MTLRLPCADAVLSTDRDGGVTLIELVIVLAILGVLSGIAVLSYQAFADGGEAAQAAIEETEGDVTDRLDAVDDAGFSSVDLLPPEPPEVTGLGLDPPADDLLVSDDVTEVTATPTFEADGGEVEILIEIVGANPDTETLDPEAPLTFSYTGAATGVDTIRSCTGRYGQAPEACDVADTDLVVSAPVTRTWWTLPTVDEARIGDVEDERVESIRVTWDQNVTATGPPWNYRIYSHPACASWSSVAQGFARAGGSGPEVEVVLPWWTTWAEDDPGWLRIEAATEENGGGFTNETVDCIRIGEP